MRMAILTESGGWHVEDLRRAAVAAGHTFITCSWKAVCARVGDEANDAGPAVRSESIDLMSADAVLVRTMPAGSLEQVVFRMDALHRLAAAGRVVINPPRAIEAAVDKYLSLSRIEHAPAPGSSPTLGSSGPGKPIRVPATAACQRAVDAMAAFEQFGGDVVVKPLFGSEGFGVMRITQRELASRVFTAIERMQSVIYVQQYIDAAAELRLFVIDDRVIAAMRRTGDAWPRNASRGNAGEAIDPPAEIAELATRAARACDALVAGVDVLIDRAGRAYVLEVNASPGWRVLKRATGVDVAAAIVEFAGKRAAGAIGRAFPLAQP